MSRWPARIGRWEVAELLGVGGMAEVRRGVGSEGEVALKRSAHPADRSLAEAYTQALRTEARALSRVRHPQVVGFVDWIDEDSPTLVMERLRGRVLAGLVLPFELALELAVQAAEALAAVHAAVDEAGAPLELVHRDVSPDNLFLVEGGALRLFDFNVAHLRGGPPPTGALQGRVAYMAPEQARGEAVEARADVFSLGVVLWEWIEGRRLFWRGNTLATLRALVDEPIASIDARHPAALASLIGEALDRDPRARPEAAAFATRLRALLLDDPTRAARLDALARAL